MDKETNQKSHTSAMEKCTKKASKRRTNKEIFRNTTGSIWTSFK